MKLKLRNHDIKAISVALPRSFKSLDDELEFCNLSAKKYEILKAQTGINTHFTTNENTFASDLATSALNELLKSEILAKNELDMLIISSFTPDFYAPGLSSLVAKNLNLNKNTLCFDEIGFCAGFLQGLFKAFLALENESIKKVVLLCVNVKSKKISPKDKISYLSITDSASAVLIEKSNSKQNAFYSQQTFSEHALQETLPCNAFNENFDDFIRVDGDLIFSFVMQNFPEFFNDFLNEFKLDKNKELFLQASSNFFKAKLLEKLESPYKEDEVLKNFGDANINKIPLELALKATGGGGLSKLLAS